MRVGYAEVFVGIDRDIINADFIVKVRASASSAVPHVSNGIAAMHMLPGIDRKALHVSVAGRDSVTVIDDDRASVAAHEIGELHNTLGRSHDRLTVKSANIDARVKCTFTV